MRFRIAIVVVAAALLSGCGWMGPAFYKGDPKDAGPIKPGLYKVDFIGDGKPARTYRIAWLPDGSISSTPQKPGKDDDVSHYVAVRLVVPGRDLWILQDMPDTDQSDVSYGLAELHADVLWAAPIIDCNATVEIVRAAGGDVEDTVATNVVEANDASPATTLPTPRISEKPTGQRCRFKDRASLERALRAYVATDRPFWMRVRFKRIGN